MDYKNETPSKSKANLIKVLNCDSPFKLLPHFSTPPSRFTKILNPFEQHVTDRLHLPTFSPGVFAQVSTPKTGEKFKWNIEDISRLKPADIDEATVSQHVSNHDPTIESMVQEKIDKFFSEKAIVPSPFNEQIKQISLVPFSPPQPKYSTKCVQTLLTLPPRLPKHVEDVLAPYFNFGDEEDDPNSSLYKKLFESEDREESDSVCSSPAPMINLSPIEFSPDFKPRISLEESGSILELAQLKDCTLSPIGSSPMSRSACRLNFSSYMSVDASMMVPDVQKSLNKTSLEMNISPLQPLEEHFNESVNWEMEYKQIAALKSPNTELLNSSNSNTPHSRIFTSQRKRLSDSFKEDSFGDVEMEEKDASKRQKSRFSVNDVTDGGYITGESSSHMFASTPTKIH